MHGGVWKRDGSNGVRGAQNEVHGPLTVSGFAKHLDLLAIEGTRVSQRDVLIDTQPPQLLPENLADFAHAVGRISGVCIAWLAAVTEPEPYAPKVHDVVQACTRLLATLVSSR